jgi:hypothetical protein
MDRWNEMREVGSTNDTGNVEYFRALKRTNEGAAPSSPTSAFPSEQRRSPRYQCEGSAEFRSEGTTVRTWARVTDLSRSGCYVEMQATSPVNTRVDMVVDVSGIRVQVKGTVRVSYPFLGMGIAFTEISPEEQGRLEELLSRLATGVIAPAGQAAGPKESANSDGAWIADPRGAIRAVSNFFDDHNTLTREQFFELLEKYGGR